MTQHWNYTLPDGTPVTLAPYDGRPTNCGTCCHSAQYRLAIEGRYTALKCAACAQGYLHRMQATFTGSSIPGDTPDDCPDHGDHNEEYCPGCKREEHRRSARAAGVTPGY